MSLAPPRALAPYPFSAQRHAATLPPLRDGADAQRHRVVVAGGGPVGLCAALGLAAHGVKVLLIEADDSVCAGSRAICISRRSLEIIERLGALPGFLATGLPWTGGRSFYRQAEVLRFAMPQDENQKLPPMINLAQYHIEDILLERALQLPELIEIRWQTRVTAIDARSDGVTLTLATPDASYQLDTGWVVAADGGRSLIRESLGLPLQGTSYEGRYVIVDIALDSERPAERLAYFDPPCNPGSTVLVHKQPHGVWRIDYQLRDGEDPEAAIRPENVLPRVESLLAMMGERGAWAPIWITVYKANALTLERFRHGRVLLAGDAAHLLPIFGVRGANSGIDDADNLAWKLALVVKGRADERLLDSYSHERVAAAHENLAHGRKSTEFMAPPSFAFELMRRAVLSLAADHAALRPLVNPRQTTAISYADSPLNAASDRFDAGPAPGTVLPECPLTIEVSGERRPGHITDLLGPHFTALHFGSAVPHELRALERTLAERGVPFKLRAVEHRAPLWAMYGARPGSVYLVRPDGHVLARRHRASAADIAAAIDHAMCRDPEKPR